MGRRQWKYVDRLANASAYWQSLLFADIWNAAGVTPFPRRSDLAREELLAAVGGAPAGFVSGTTFAVGSIADPVSDVEAAFPAAANPNLLALINLGQYNGMDRIAICRSDGTLWRIMDATYAAPYATIAAATSIWDQPIGVPPAELPHPLLIDTDEGVMYMGYASLAAIAPDGLIRGIPIDDTVQPALGSTVIAGLQVGTDPVTQGWTDDSAMGGTVNTAPGEFLLVTGGAGGSLAGISDASGTGGAGTLLTVDAIQTDGGDPTGAESARIEISRDNGADAWRAALVVDFVLFANLNWHLVDVSGSAGSIDTGELATAPLTIELFLSDGACRMWVDRTLVPQTIISGLGTVASTTNGAEFSSTNNGALATMTMTGVKVVEIL